MTRPLLISATVVVVPGLLGMITGTIVGRSRTAPPLAPPQTVLWDAPSYDPGPYGEGQRAEGLAFAQRWPERPFPEPGVVVARLLKIAPAAVLAPTQAAAPAEPAPEPTPGIRHPEAPVAAAAPLDGVCARYHLRRVWTDRWRWRCRRG